MNECLIWFLIISINLTILNFVIFILLSKTKENK